jgi:hypothetical protein
MPGVPVAPKPLVVVWVAVAWLLLLAVPRLVKADVVVAVLVGGLLAL